ncbi:MAG TPA: hypothetical protein PLY87_14345 [Planctomycetaceae bacterium]|nr:hypothetical protein [Planctomycetaceae bacterium]
MPLRRTLLTVLSFAVFGNIPLVAQEKDPFAEWDRQNARTPTKSSAAKPESDAAAKSTVTYFSPAATAEATNAAAEATPTAPVATLPMREKTPLRQNIERLRVPVTASNAATVPGAVGSTRNPGGLTSPPTVDKHAAPIARGNIDSVELSPDKKISPKASGIRNAAFSPELESGSKKSIQQISGEAGGDSRNAFDDFLNTSSADNRQEPAEFDRTADAELNGAEPLFNPGAASDQKTGANAVIPSSPPGANNGPQSPGVTLQWIKHGGFNVGQECSVELVVKNSSPTVVRSVIAEAVVPANVEFVGSRPAAVEGSDTPTWTFGELQPGQSRSVMLTVIPKSRGEALMEGFVRLTGSSSSQFSVQEPLIGVVVNGPERVEIGQQVGYVVRVSNPGTGLANNVIIQAAVPEGLEHRNGSLLTIEIGTLNPGESRQARLSLTAVQGGKQQLAVRVLADGGLSDQTTTAIEVAEPNLSIAITGAKDAVAGRSENYTLTVSNSGNVQSANVRAKYRIPDGFSFISADRGGKYVEIDQAVEWFVGTLQPNDSSEFHIAMKANETGELVHQAGVISEHGHVTTCDLTTQVAGSASLDVKIAAVKREIHVGDEITWEITVRNTGSREASNVGVSCELPIGFDFIEADGPTKYIAENGVLVFRSIPAIDVGTDAKILVHGRCSREGNQRLRLRVASESINEVLIGEEFASVVP